VILVIDASVAVKWFVDEERCDLARSVFRQGIELTAPDLLLVEVANAVRNKARFALMTPAQARNAVNSLQGLFDRLAGPRGTITQAFDLAHTLNHPVADCMYLALARVAGGTLLTDDGALYLKAVGAKVEVVRLSDWSPDIAAASPG